MIRFSKAFTLVEMLIAVMLTALVFTYLYAVLDNVQLNHDNQKTALDKVEKSQKIFQFFLKDFSQIRDFAQIFNDAGYSRIAFVTAHSIYNIPQPWVHYFISEKEHALIRIEANQPIDFTRSDYVGDFNSTYFFADKLATHCDSLRFHTNKTTISVMLRCQDISPIVATVFKGMK